MCIPVCAHVDMGVHTHRAQRRTLGILFLHPLHYSLETGCLAEPGVGLVASQQAGVILPAPICHSAVVLGTYARLVRLPSLLLPCGTWGLNSGLQALGS